MMKIVSQTNLEYKNQIRNRLQLETLKNGFGDR